MRTQLQSVLTPCLFLLGCLFSTLHGEVKTWDGRHSIKNVHVKVVYFVPHDREPLSDWKDRAQYYCDRIEQFHEREYGGESILSAELEQAPFKSRLATQELRSGDGDAIFFRTLREVDEHFQFGIESGPDFPILLVLSEMNWRPLDDFYRLKPSENGPTFEGNYTNQQHFPGAASGGARATYLAEKRKGWGLVSADGWRVPYRGSDCVVYHEGVGHTVGLPHPQPGNGSVMSLGQYQGWIHESWLDNDQKIHMNWQGTTLANPTPQQGLFSQFRALPVPLVPKAGEPVSLQFEWPKNSDVAECVVEYQTAIHGPWVRSPASVMDGETGEIPTISLGSFDRPTPVSYRVKTKLVNGATAELWGYFQVRNSPQEYPLPTDPFVELAALPNAVESHIDIANEVNILPQLDLDKQWKQGEWTIDEQGALISPKAYGSRLELPIEIPRNYRLLVIAEPLDAPNGLLIGSRMGEQRFATLINYTPAGVGLSALENVDGKNVGNPTTLERTLLKQNQLFQVVVMVQNDQVRVAVDNESIIAWNGAPERLSLGDYWSTPDPQALFLGAYDCRYRFHRVSLVEIK